MKNVFSIGEVAKIKDITIKALRYYHKMGILIPKHIDEISGYRYYSIDQFVYIDIIKACRALGTSIVELQEIFKECNMDKLLEFLTIKRYEAEENIKKMQEIIKNIDTLDKSVKYSREILNDSNISIKFFEERYIITSPCKEAGSLNELLYYSNLDKLIQGEKLNMTMERGIIYKIDSLENVEPIYVFNGIQESNDIKNESNIKILPKGKYLTLTYSKENEDQRIRKVVDYAREHNFKFENIIEIELFNDFFNLDSYSCQIQILIQEK